MAEKRVNASEPFIKTILKRILEDLDYGLYRAGLKKMHPHIRVMSIDETIDEMLNTKKSLVRFGDGEVAMMRGVNLKLQQVSPGLVDRMKDIIAGRKARRKVLCRHRKLLFFSLFYPR